MERGRLRLFAINKTEAEIRTILDEGTHGIQKLLGANDLNPDYIEVFRVADLGDMGLDDYLHTGYDIPRAQLDPQAGACARSKAMCWLCCRWRSAICM